MSDMPIDAAGQIAPPKLSEEALASYRAQLADPIFQREFPRQFEALRQSVDNALAVTGQALDPNPDQRTPAQRHYDRNFGMEPNPELVAAVLRDAQAEPSDPEQTGKALAGIGMTHKDALDLAQHAVHQRQELAGVKVENLPAVTLAVLARYGQHLRRYEGKRPAVGTSREKVAEVHNPGSLSDPV